MAPMPFEVSMLETSVAPPPPTTAVRFQIAALKFLRCVATRELWSASSLSLAKLREECPLGEENWYEVDS